MEFDGAKNLAELHYLLKKTVMIRRLKSEVLAELPSKQRQIITIETDKNVINEIKELLNSTVSVKELRESDRLMDLFSKRDDESFESSSVMRCYMLSGIAKLNSVK